MVIVTLQCLAFSATSAPTWPNLSLCSNRCGRQRPRPFPSPTTSDYEYIRAGPSHGRVRRGRSRHRCPTALFDEGPLLPRIDLFEFRQTGCGIGLMLEFVDAYGRECRYDGGFGAFLHHLFCGAAGDPATPVETDNERRDGAGGYSLKKTGQRLALKD